MKDPFKIFQDICTCISQNHSENITRSLKLFFLTHTKIASFNQNALWIYKKYAKVWCTHTSVVVPSALWRKSPSCPCFCFAPWGSDSTHEKDSYQVELWLKNKNRLKKICTRAYWPCPSPWDHDRINIHCLKPSSLQHASAPSLLPNVHPCDAQQCGSANKTVLQRREPSPFSHSIIQNHWAPGTGYL